MSFLLILDVYPDGMVLLELKHDPSQILLKLKVPRVGLVRVILEFEVNVSRPPEFFLDGPAGLFYLCNLPLVKNGFSLHE